MQSILNPKQIIDPFERSEFRMDLSTEDSFSNLNVSLIFQEMRASQKKLASAFKRLNNNPIETTIPESKVLVGYSTRFETENILPSQKLQNLLNSRSNN